MSSEDEPAPVLDAQHDEIRIDVARHRTRHAREGDLYAVMAAEGLGVTYGGSTRSGT
ncbi:hypothetical protein [Rhodococcus opacus]